MSTFFAYAQGAADAYFLAMDKAERHTEDELETLLGKQSARDTNPAAHADRATAPQPPSRALPWRDLGLLAVVLVLWMPFLSAI